MPVEDAVAALRGFLVDAAAGVIVDRSAILAPYNSNSMAERHAAFFQACRQASGCQPVSVQEV
jgi:hypothetical protein